MRIHLRMDAGNYSVNNYSNNYNQCSNNYNQCTMLNFSDVYFIRSTTII